ncbi:hypothetical protein NQ176_g8953 [Zarea fungicola]|uniref:Uncharacterized protein n=1 Tax=Zarea fungicola TaxID=93591 RepID=A0ACC1MRJ7_9HYPO|nr:hypothetical protein NQ176_g8953 [Lecanicillium fungicola]
MSRLVSQPCSAQQRRVTSYQTQNAQPVKVTIALNIPAPLSFLKKQYTSATAHIFSEYLLRSRRRRAAAAEMSWDLLDERSEAELHKVRLLNVEEKPFKRVTKRVAVATSLISKITKNEEQREAAVASTGQLQEDLALDFAAFNSSIARLQFLHDANHRERARYEDDKKRILEECQAVRERNAELREQLEGARATLAQRKKFDELAEKITSNRLLRPREDQLTNLDKLEEECRELERESETYTETWKERREQFNRIMDEGTLLRRQIRDEKEEVDRREGMNEGTEDDVVPTPRNELNGSATPRPDGEEAAKGEEDSTTSRPATATGTPAGDHLQVPSAANGGTSKQGSAVGSTAGSPIPNEEEDEGEVSGEDVEMDGGDSAGQSVSIMLQTPEPENEKMEVDG